MVYLIDLMGHGGGVSSSLAGQKFVEEEGHFPPPADTTPAGKCFSGIDIGKFFFACLIPLLHIALPASPVLRVIQQYVSRLGVPFFFTFAGFAMSASIQERGRVIACKRYFFRTARLLLVWLLIYSPVLFLAMRDDPAPFRNLLFLTPAYLWYLTALVFATVPFCLIKSRKLLWGICAGLYAAGTLLGGSYSWLTGGWPAYERIFITTRNGLFFGLPMLCVGELVYMRRSRAKKHCSVAWLLASGCLLALEITFIMHRVDLSSGVDCSMYLTLPLFCGLLCFKLIEAELNIRTLFLRKASVAVYVMQFGVIAVFSRIFPFFGISAATSGWLTWAAVILCGCFAAWVVGNSKLSKLLF